MKAARETETKLAAWAGFALPDLTGVLDGVTSKPFPERVLEATYYDTADLRLARWGASLRYRTGDGTGWTVKLADGRLADGKPADGEDGPALVRREITFPAQAAGPIPAEAGNLVRAYTPDGPTRGVGPAPHPPPGGRAARRRGPAAWPRSSTTRSRCSRAGTWPAGSASSRWRSTRAPTPA